MFLKAWHWGWTPDSSLRVGTMTHWEVTVWFVPLISANVFEARLPVFTSVNRINLLCWLSGWWCVWNISTATGRADIKFSWHIRAPLKISCQNFLPMDLNHIMIKCQQIISLYYARFIWRVLLVIYHYSTSNFYQHFHCHIIKCMSVNVLGSCTDVGNDCYLITNLASMFCLSGFICLHQLKLHLTKKSQVKACKQVSRRFAENMREDGGEGGRENKMAVGVFFFFFKQMTLTNGSPRSWTGHSQSTVIYFYVCDGWWYKKNTAAALRLIHRNMRTSSVDVFDLVMGGAECGLIWLLPGNRTVVSIRVFSP